MKGHSDEPKPSAPGVRNARVQKLFRPASTKASTAMTAWRVRLHDIIFEADTKAGKAFDVALLWAIMLSVLAVMLESVASIEARWGLSLQPGIAGDGREEHVEIGGHSVPVVLGGRFQQVPPAGGTPADCELRNAGLVAICAIGAGRAVLVADATMFERASPPRDARAVLWDLLGMTGDEPGA